MQTKLTLRMEDDVIRRAKHWARRRGVSLSQVVASVLDQLPRRREASRLSPWTQKLLGLAQPRKGRPATDGAAQEAYADHVAERHR